jgi:hypothetical protein
LIESRHSSAIATDAVVAKAAAMTSIIVFMVVSPLIQIVS